VVVLATICDNNGCNNQDLSASGNISRTFPHLHVLELAAVSDPPVLAEPGCIASCSLAFKKIEIVNGCMSNNVCERTFLKV